MECGISSTSLLPEIKTWTQDPRPSPDLCPHSQEMPTRMPWIIHHAPPWHLHKHITSARPLRQRTPPDAHSAALSRWGPALDWTQRGSGLPLIRFHIHDTPLHPHLCCLHPQIPPQFPSSVSSPSPRSPFSDFGWHLRCEIDAHAQSDMWRHAGRRYRAKFKSKDPADSLPLTSPFKHDRQRMEPNAFFSTSTYLHSLSFSAQGWISSGCHVSKTRLCDSQPE